jgi:hypothetical protein
VVLRRQGATWLVETEGNNPADPKIPKQILEGMDKLSTRTLISISKETHAGFEVDSTGFTVRITGGGKALAEFVVGKPGPDFMSTYIRPLSGDKVYLVPVYLRTTVDRGGETWRNKTILDVDTDKIVSYTTRNAKETLTCQKAADGSWDILSPKQDKARPDILGVVLRSIAALRAAGFADSTVTASTCGLDADTTAFSIKMEDGTSYTVRIGTMNAGSQSYTQREGDPTIYLVARGRWNTIFRPFDLLCAASKPGNAPGAPANSLPGVALPGGAK